MVRCTGYDDTHIPFETLEAIYETKDTDGKYERDSSIIVGEPNFAFKALEWIKKASNNKCINIVDFGGSLGSTYFQLLPYLSDYETTWNVLEQESFVTVGKKNLEDKNLKFYSKIDDFKSTDCSRIFFSSSTIQYLEEPFEVLRGLNLRDYEYLIFDRISVIDLQKDRLTVQIVPPSRYKSIYPCWFLSESNFITQINSLGFSLIDLFSAIGGKEATKAIKKSAYKGFIFKKSDLKV